MNLAAAAGHTATAQLLLAAPQLTNTRARTMMAGAAGAAAAAGHTDLAILVFRALLSRDMQAAVQELAARQPGAQALAAEVLSQWQAAEATVTELEARWPALQQLLLGFSATHKQMQAAAADVSDSAVSAAEQAGTPVCGEAGSGLAVVAAATADAVAGIADVAPRAECAAAQAAATAVGTAAESAAVQV